MARITHFEIPANDPEKLTAFYEKVLDGSSPSGADRKITGSRKPAKASPASTARSCGADIPISLW